MGRHRAQTRPHRTRWHRRPALATTHDPGKVTCEICLRLMAQAQAG